MRSSVVRLTGLTAAAVLLVGLQACGDSADDAANAERAFDMSELDSAVKPCENLYKFVNGKPLAARTIPDDKAAVSLMGDLNDRSLETQRALAEDAAKSLGSLDRNSDRWKVGAFYKTATDEAAIEKAGAEPLKPDLARVDAIKTREDLVKFFHEEARAGGGAVVFGVGSHQDFKDATKQIAAVGSSALRLSDKDAYTDPGQANIVAAYKTYLETVLKLTGSDAGAAARQAAEAYGLEARLAEASLTPLEGRDPANQYKWMTIAEANAVTPLFDWGAFLAAQGINQPGFSFPETKYFARFNELLATTPIEQWKTYLRAQVIVDKTSYLSKPFRDARFAFAAAQSGQKAQPPRWKTAVSSLNANIGMAMGRLYVEQNFTPSAKQEADKLVANVLAAFRKRIENVSWMGADTKKTALGKLDTIVPKIGHPDEQHWRDWSGLKLSDSSYYENVHATAVYNTKYELSKIGKPADRKDWLMTPQTVNAYYNPQDNTINFPAAFLQAPVFDPKADDALNYGGLGSVIGHEITHGFDDKGRAFDAKGNHSNWWAAADSARFTKDADKLVAQYNSYAPIEGKPDLRVNGKLTLGENIADLGGALAGYDAFAAANPGALDARIAGYTGAQRYFLSLARFERGKARPEAEERQMRSDPHSPSITRVNGVVPNVPSFAKAFGCGNNDPMVHSGDKLVTIW